MPKAMFGIKIGIKILSLRMILWKKMLIGRFKLAYMSGKRTKLVPLLIIDDCWKAWKFLLTPSIESKQMCIQEISLYFHLPDSQLDMFLAGKLLKAAATWQALITLLPPQACGTM